MLFSARQRSWVWFSKYITMLTWEFVAARFLTLTQCCTVTVPQLSVLDQDNLAHWGLFFFFSCMLSMGMFDIFFPSCGMFWQDWFLKKEWENVERGKTASFKEHEETTVSACDIEVCVSIHKVSQLETVCGDFKLDIQANVVLHIFKNAVKNLRVPKKNCLLYIFVVHVL